LSTDPFVGLAELESRLTALREQLTANDGPPAPGPSPAASAADADATAAVDATGGDGASTESAAGMLAGWSEALGRLVADLSALQSDLDDQVARRAGERSSAVAPAAAIPSDTSATVWPTAVPAPYDRVFIGHLTVDVGPFADITAVGNFQRALHRIPATRDAYLTAFAGDRATFDVELGGPVALGRSIRGVVPFNFVMLETAPSVISLNLDMRSPRHQFGPPA
jgi:hypothetical protein